MGLYSTISQICLVSNLTIWRIDPFKGEGCWVGGWEGIGKEAGKGVVKEVGKEVWKKVGKEVGKCAFLTNFQLGLHAKCWTQVQSRYPFLTRLFLEISTVHLSFRNRE